MQLQRTSFIFSHTCSREVSSLDIGIHWLYKSCAIF